MTKVWTGQSEGATEEFFGREEYNLTGTSVTGHKEFDDNGYLVARNLFDPKESLNHYQKQFQRICRMLFQEIIPGNMLKKVIPILFHPQ